MLSGKLFAILGAVVLAVAVNGSPADDGTNPKKHPPPKGNVLFCANAKWHGPCQEIAGPNDACTEFPANFGHAIAAFSPDKGATCTLFDGANCGGSSLSKVVYPGHPDLAKENHKPVTFKCDRPMN